MNTVQQIKWNNLSTWISESTESLRLDFLQNVGPDNSHYVPFSDTQSSTIKLVSSLMMRYILQQLKVRSHLTAATAFFNKIISSLSQSQWMGMEPIHLRHRSHCHSRGHRCMSNVNDSTHYHVIQLWRQKKRSRSRIVWTDLKRASFYFQTLIQKEKDTICVPIWSSGVSL